MTKNTNDIKSFFLNYFSPRQADHKEKIFPLKMVVSYIFVSQLWIITSDKILLLTIDDIALLNRIQTFKGSFFIIMTSIFIYNLCSALSSTKRSEEKAIWRNKVQTQFFANLSHDLKTPLNLIFTSIQMVELHWRSTFQYPNKYIKIMQQNSYRLIKLINNITDITKFDSGFLDIKLKDYNIVGIVEDISLSIVEYIEHKGIKFLFDTDIEEKIIACDPDKIERIMLNLLSNAVKFTKEGGMISVNIYDRVENIVISVKDTGRGIPDEKQKTIFNRFMQINNSDVQEHEGSGIGLSVVKSLVEMHKGDVSCISEFGKGSDFIIELPVISISKENDIRQEIIDKKINDFAEKINIEFSDIYCDN